MTVDAPASRHSEFRIWSVCFVLLLASSINYMDRQTLSNVSVRIKTEFGLSGEQYGQIELAFGWAFAIGATVFGVIADRTSIRWLYPAVLLAWSIMGILTGWANSFASLLVCRLMLGFFEAGHWPCALKTTQRLLPSNRRTLGNSVLQSGTAIGAIITPLIMLALLTDDVGSWRPAFQIIGGIGIFWIALWLWMVRGLDLETPVVDHQAQSSSGWKSFLNALCDYRFLILILVVISINTAWHLLRAWLPMFLQEGRGYSEKAMLAYMFWYNVATDVGCLTAGAATIALGRRGWSSQGARVGVFCVCALLTSLCGLLPWLPQGPALLGVFLLVAMGSLGLFPCYYAFSQEVSIRHQGKVTGLLGTIAWLTTSPMHILFGQWIDKTGSFDLGLMLAGLVPVPAALLLLLTWRTDRPAVELTRAE